MHQEKENAGLKTIPAQNYPLPNYDILGRSRWEINVWRIHQFVGQTLQHLYPRVFHKGHIYLESNQGENTGVLERKIIRWLFLSI